MEQRLPVYLIVTEDPFVAETETDSILKGVDDVSITRLDSTSDDTSILQALTATPMLAQDSALALSDVSAMNAATQRAIVSWIEDPPPGMTLVMTASKSVAKIAAATKAAGRIIDGAKLRRSDLVGWVVGGARQRHLKLTSEGAATLIEALGQSKTALAGALDELAIAADGKRIGPDEVRTQFQSHMDVGVFGFVDAVAERKKEQALKVFNVLVNRGEEVSGLFWALARHFRLMLRASGRRAGEVASDLGLQQWRAEKILRQSKFFSDAELVSSYQAIAGIDRKMRSSAGTERDLVERLVVTIAGPMS